MSRDVVVSLSGGLGNQMFQYAFAKSYAEKYNQKIKIELGFFQQSFDRDTTPREFGLECYNLSKQIEKKYSLPFYAVGFLGKFTRLLNRAFRLGLREIVYEKGFQYSPLYLNKKGAYVFVGYWQSYKYCESVIKKVKEDFKLTCSLSDTNKERLFSMNNSNSIALHVRRGDYISNNAAASFHGVCSVEYYKKAFELISEKINNPKVFIFSDDLDWVKKNLVINCAVEYIEGNDDKPEIDIMLMSNCNHFIIANSSFSWWGAFLGQNDNSIVIRPKLWFVENNERTKDLCPDKWIAL
jgi:hypothetical protein